jgi:radical SAM protein with 4Fe4S-binding SPASM domain
MIAIQDLTDWSLELARRTAERRTPISGVIELTQRCNMGCIHCYTNLPARDRTARAGELSFDEICRILNEIVDAGCLWLLFTGGEIFLRKDFIDIYTYAKQKGLLLALFTNGTLITPRIAEKLAQYPPFLIEITLYGRSREIYEQITGVEGSYDHCLEGIRLLKERRLPLKLKTVAMRPNLRELWDLKRYVEADLGLEFRFDPMINPRIDCSMQPLAVRLSPEEIVALDLKDPARIDEWRRFQELFGGGPVSNERLRWLYRCGGGVQSFAVDPYGRLRVCVLSNHGGYDLRNGSFHEGWERFMLDLRRQKITRQTKCVACGLKSMCGMCPANAELECADPEAPVDFLCQVAHLRAYALGLPVPRHGECEYCEGGSGHEKILEMLGRLNGLRGGLGAK